MAGVDLLSFGAVGVPVYVKLCHYCRLLKLQLLLINSIPSPKTKMSKSTKMCRSDLHRDNETDAMNTYMIKLMSKISRVCF